MAGMFSDLLGQEDNKPVQNSGGMFGDLVQESPDTIQGGTFSDLLEDGPIQERSKSGSLLRPGKELVKSVAAGTEQGIGTLGSLAQWISEQSPIGNIVRIAKMKGVSNRLKNPDISKEEKIELATEILGPESLAKLKEGDLSEVELKKLANKAVGHGEFLAEKGEKWADWWNEQASKGWEAPDPEVSAAKWSEAPISKAAQAIGGGATSVATAIASSAITKNPKVGLTILGLQAGAGQYGKHRKKDVGVSTASTLASLTTAWEMVTEKIPFDAMLKGGKPLLKKVVTSAGLEGVQEFVQNIGENFLEHFGYKSEESIPDAVKEGLKHTMDDWLANVVAGVGLGGGGAVLGSALSDEQGPKPKKEIDSNLTLAENTYMHGFSNKLASVRMDAESLLPDKKGQLLDASKRKRIAKSMLDSIDTIEAHYESISDIIADNPEELSHLVEVKGLLPEYSKNVSDFVKNPSKWGYGKIKDTTSKIADLANSFGKDINTQRAKEISGVRSLSAEEKAQAQEKQFTETASKDIVESNMTQEEKDAALDELIDAPEKILQETELEGEEIPTSPKAMAEKLIKAKPTKAAEKLLTVLKTARKMGDAMKAERKQEFVRRVKTSEAALDMGSGQVAFKQARGALKGELPGTSFELDNTLTENDINALAEQIRTSPILQTLEKQNAFDALKKVLLNNKVPAAFEMKLLDKVFGKEVGSALADFAKFTNTNKALFAGIINIPRTTLASMDVSAVGRQGFFAGVGHPIIWAKMFISSLKTLVSEDAARQVDLEIRLNPYFGLAQKSDLVVRDYGASTENKTDEYIAADLIRRPKSLSKKKGLSRLFGEIAFAMPTGIGASERSYVTSLNKMRMDLFSHYAKSWEGTNKTSADYKAMAELINHATGESNIKFLEDNSGILNAAFFAPRWTASRFQLVTDLVSGNKAARKIAAQMWMKYLLAGSTAIGLLALAGADTEMDPRSSDFGKVVMGNTRIDFWGGHTQMVRLMAGLLTGEKKSGSGKISDKSRLAIVGRFLESKSSPVAGLALDLLRGETFLGDDVYGEDAKYLEQIYNRTAPLFIQDIIDTARYQGIGSAVTAAPFAFSGIGIQTYPMRDTQHLSNEKDRLAKETFGKAWEDLGPDLQKMIKQYNPQLDRMDKKIKAERDDYDFIGKSLEEQQKAGEKVFKSLPKNIQLELDRILVGVGGLSRRVGSNWYLNNTKYKQYQTKTANILNKVLPKIIYKSTWNSLNEEQQQMIMDEIISKAKDTVRNQIILDAKREDLITIQKRKAMK